MLVTALVIFFVVSLMIFVNALYVAGEFSSVSARKTRIVQWAEEGNRLAQTLLPILEDRHKLDNYIAACQVGITLSSIVLGIYGEQQIAPRIAPWIARLPFIPASANGEHLAASGIAATLVLLLLTTLQVVLGELVPKSIGVQYPEKLALVTVLPIKWSADYLLKPLIVLLNGSGALILKLLGIQAGGEHAHVHSPEEIQILVKESYRGGLIGAEERQFLENVFRSLKRQAGEIATPRTRIVAASITQPLHEVLALAADSAYSRLPIHEGDLDHIIGFVHLRDLFLLHQSNPHGDLRTILRPVPFVPATLSSAELWSRLEEAQSYLAIVFDEFGGTAGLITREDLVEELFGELQDEFDEEGELLTATSTGQFIACGELLVAALNDRLEIDLPYDRAHTIGGLVMAELGRIAQVGDEVEVAGVRLRVEAVSHRSVERVSITLPTAGGDTPPKGYKP